MALYSGARSSSEIARIRLDDIYKEQEIDVINLSLASKNVRSKRIVPIHPALIKLGFLDYADKLRKKGKERLFPIGNRKIKSIGGSCAPTRPKSASTTTAKCSTASGIRLRPRWLGMA